MRKYWTDPNEFAADMRARERARCVGVLRNMARLADDQADAASVQVAATIEGLKGEGLWTDIVAAAAVQVLEEAIDKLQRC